MVADRESSELARLLLSETIKKERVDPATLTVHADRGSSMTYARRTARPLHHHQRFVALHM
jgi:hypothetical protein